MQFQYNRRLALILTLLVVLGAILIGGGASLQRDRDRTQELFYSGMQSNGLSIASDLRARQESAYNMVTVARRYLDAKAPGITALTDAAQALAGAQSVSEFFDANYALTLAADHLYSELREKTLSAEDEKLLAGQFSELTARNLTISHDGYNGAAVEFNALLQGFPAALIAAVNGVRPLELFR